MGPPRHQLDAETERELQNAERAVFRCAVTLERAFERRDQIPDNADARTRKNVGSQVSHCQKRLEAAVDRALMISSDADLPYRTGVDGVLSRSFERSDKYINADLNATAGAKDLYDGKYSIAQTAAGTGSSLPVVDTSGLARTRLSAAGGDPPSPSRDALGVPEAMNGKRAGTPEHAEQVSKFQRMDSGMQDRLSNAELEMLISGYNNLDHLSQTPILGLEEPPLGGAAMAAGGPPIAGEQTGGGERAGISHSDLDNALDYLWGYDDNP